MKVYFNAGFLQKRHGERPCRPLPIEEQRFSWGGKQWWIPAVYQCAKGLVMDVICEIDRQAAQEFCLEVERKLLKGLSEEERRLLCSKNPMDIQFQAELKINDKPSGSWQGCVEYWLPFRRKEGPAPNQTSKRTIDPDADLLAVMEAYGLTGEKCWGVARYCFHWPNSRRPSALRSLELSLGAAARLEGVLQYFETTPNVKDMQVRFLHPVSGREHCLRVLECRPFLLPPNLFDGMERLYDAPKQLTELHYVLEPPLPQGERLLLIDTDCGDQPRKKKLTEEMREKLRRDRALSSAAASGEDASMGENSIEHAATAAEEEGRVGSVGIIGGADGPVALFTAQHPADRFITAFSALHFSQPERVRWCLVGIEVPAYPKHTVTLTVCPPPSRPKRTSGRKRAKRKAAAKKKRTARATQNNR